MVFLLMVGAVRRFVPGVRRPPRRTFAS